MAYASFQDYRELFLGRAITDEESFKRLALRAGAVLDRLSFGRAARYTDTEGKLKLACCALAEKLQAGEEEDGRIQEEQVGDYRVRYESGSSREASAELAALAELWLAGTGLLYRGVPCTRRIP